MCDMKRREFLQAVSVGTCGLLGASVVPSVALGADERYLKEARFYEALPEKKVRCLVCPRQCVVGDGQRGYCRVRENIDGKYYSLVFGRVCAYHIDPIEKKPLFHFLPGTTAFSVAAVGCNLACKFCQNWEISQAKPEDVEATDLPPAKLADAATRYGSPTMAYTYTEPIVYCEYVMASAREGHERGIRSVMISAGYMNGETMRELAGAMDAIKIDLKAHSDDFYKNICSASLAPVLKTISGIKKSGTWLEIVNLIIPTLNDDDEQIESLSKWLLDNVGDEVPVHFTRFHPTYKLKNLPQTQVSSVERAREIAMAQGLKYAYVGNVPAGHPGEHTYCPGCGKAVVKRTGYAVLSIDLENGKCSACGTVIPGVWS
ncbi:MAG: AmmeMemoRadiSam system radical SAM enzyme [Candidatus Eisenbacteria bacterium]